MCLHINKFSACNASGPEKGIALEMAISLDVEVCRLGQSSFRQTHPGHRNRMAVDVRPRRLAKHFIPPSPGEYDDVGARQAELPER